MIHLGDKLSVEPTEIATQVVAALGMRGSGKSNVMAVIAEGLLKSKVQVLILDYVGIWYSLRLQPDGKRASPFEIVVIGGKHGDIPLSATSGKIVGETLAASAASAVLDISVFTKGDRCRFAADFAESLFHAKKVSYPGPCFLVLEEAQRFVPQKLPPGTEYLARMLGAFEEIAEVGRNFGLGLGLLSQRPQKINKDALNLADTVFAFRTNGVLERRAISDWVQEKGAEGREEVADELPGLPMGTALVWSPIRETYGRYKLHKKTTYDAGATPTHARAAVEIKPLDLEALKKSMATVVEQAKENDPKALRAEIARLKHELKVQHGRLMQMPQPARSVPVEFIPPVIIDQLLATTTNLGPEIEKRLARAAKEIGLYAARAVGTISDAAGRINAGKTAARLRTAAPVPVAQNSTLRSRASIARSGAESSGGLSRVARAILGVLVQRSPATDSQIAILSGYSITSSSFSNALSTLRTLELVRGYGSEPLAVTPELT